MPPDLHVLVYPGHVKDIFLRPLENGIIFGRTGGNLLIEADTDGGVVQVSIRDDGIRIAPEKKTLVPVISRVRSR